MLIMRKHIVLLWHLQWLYLLVDRFTPRRESMQCLPFSLLMCGISEGGINRLNSLKMQLYLRLSPYICLIEFERTREYIYRRVL